MRVLLVDAFPLFDMAVVTALYARGHDLMIVQSAREAMDVVQRNEFDCIFLDISTAGEAFELAEMRLLARRAAIALITTSPVDLLMSESLGKRNIEIRSASTLIATIQDLKQPVLLVAPEFHPVLMKTLKDMGLRTASATTLQFAMNVMADGWCQVVCLHADIPGLIDTGDVAIAHRVTASEIGILACGLSCTGIVLAAKPRNGREFISLLQQIAADRPVPCGIAENVNSQQREG
jgi:CheY-like chemotaxis protein